MLYYLLSRLRNQIQAVLYVVPVMLLAIVVHEYAHGWMSDRFGDPTPRNSGRLSLNPLRHLDPIGTLCLLIFHVGWANPVPIDPRFYRDRKKGILQVSLAGPVANFILALICVFLQGLVAKIGVMSSKFTWILFQLCFYSAKINVGLGLFNLIPIPPMDGSKVLGSLSPKASRLYWKYQRYWRYVLLLCVITGILSGPLNWLGGKMLDIMWYMVRLMLRIGW